MRNFYISLALMLPYVLVFLLCVWLFGIPAAMVITGSLVVLITIIGLLVESARA